MPKRYLLVFGTFLLSMLLYVDRACISAAKKEICADLSLSETEFGGILSSFTLAVQEAAYESARTRAPVAVRYEG
jgi:ACS family glucarate transporter-like MFS transporter